MLAVEKLILLVIFLIVLVIAIILLFGIGKGGIDPLLLQSRLRQCCGAFIASGCQDTTLDCGDETIDSVRTKLSMSTSQLYEFCNCPTT